MKRRAKTPLVVFLQKAFHVAVESKKTGTPPEEIIEAAKERHLSRRKFLGDTGKAALAAGLGMSFLASCTKDLSFSNGFVDAESPDDDAKMSKSEAKVAIIGGGIAGLHALHILKQEDVNVTLYEGSERIGGRIMTAHNVMASGLTTEFGGEFLDSGHTDMLDLASYFGLNLLDTQAPSEQALIKDAYYFNGQHHTLAQVVAAFSAIASQMEADINSLSDDISFESFSPTDEYFDNLSISSYLDSIGATGLIKELLLVAYETEYGLSCDEQSSINLLWLISADISGGSFEIFGESDERYKVEGGNQQIVDALAALYPNDIKMGRKLTAIDKVNDEYELYLTGYNNPKKYDYVLFAIPFTTLRNVNFQLNLPSWKSNAIDNLGYGTNAKLMMGVTKRKWRENGYTGYAFTDNGMQSGWDNSQLQPGSAGGYTVFLGGQKGVNLGNGSLQSKVNQYLPKVNEIFPGTQGVYNNNAARFHWPSHPWSLGSYPCYTVGQYTTIAGAEFKKVGKLYFAGDHCSSDFQGYMNGGAWSGRKAANRILNQLF